jgi:Cd2+/Zn2+-exporting ATPase
MTKKQKKSLIIIILSIILFVCCKVITANFSLQNSLGEYVKWVEIALYLIPYLTAGFTVLRKAVLNIFSGRMLDENFLMAVATIGAFILGEYQEAIVVVVLYRVGLLFESFATERSRRSIEELMNIMPEYANLLKDGEILVVDPEEVKIGDTIVIKAGEKIPLDGKVIETLNERTTPKFERARLLGNTIFISGTAAIKGEQSLNNLNAVEQTAETMGIMDRLVSKENIPTENNGSHYDLLRIYVKRSEDIEPVRDYMNVHYPETLKHYLVADVCRPELLVEIEGIANI